MVICKGLLVVAMTDQNSDSFVRINVEAALSGDMMDLPCIGLLQLGAQYRCLRGIKGRILQLLDQTLLVICHPLSQLLISSYISLLDRR